MRNRRGDLGLVGVLGALSWIPLFLSHPGQVAADTKQYLYLDPTRLTTGAASMWDPDTGLGTVTHQNIGYLLPMGPYYSLVSWLGVPMWVGQRIWMGTLMVAAGTGVAYCARRLGLEGPGRWVAALAYTLSPYILDYLDRTSAILMPWAALGWMVGLVATSARTGRWRHPALFALVVALVGGVNATSILLVIAAPAAWLVHAVWASREITLRRALATAGRLALLSTAVSVWWAAGLWVEGRYGINILRVTETVPTVSSTSSAAEVLRGLGYWYFYGWDKVQPWTLQAPPYTQSPRLLAVSFALPGLAMVLGLVTRWVYRSYCLLLVGVGTVVAVGAFPYSRPSLFGALIKGASAGSTLALAMRSVDRIVPVVVLGLALLMGAGVTSLHLRRPTFGLAAAAAAVALVAADLPALWTGGLIASNLTRPGTVPSYWTQAARYLDSLGSAAGRVLGLPGEDFAAYSWGVTMDPVPPGLLTRPYVSRQVVPAGSPASANLLQALDEPLQEGTLYPPALAPVARLMGAGQVLLQSDLQYERYHLPLPQTLYALLTGSSAGLGPPTSFGAPDPARPIRYPLDSELRLGIPTGTGQPPALSVFDVPGARPLVRAEATGAPIVVAGDGAGVVEAAGAGLLDGSNPILYAASSDGAPPPGATLVLTDTNPRSAYKWGGLQADIGQVQQAGASPLTGDPSDYTLPVFPGETDADRTVAELSGLASVDATQYGDSLSFTPEDRPVNAFDGDPTTAWTFGAHEAVAGIRLRAVMTAPVTADRLTLHQVRQLGPVDRRITSVTLTFDGGRPVTVALGPGSLSAGGQTVRFPTRTFSRLDVVIDGATGGADKRFDGLPQVGFSEIDVPGVGPATESLRLPTELLARAGTASLSDPLDVLLDRQRAIEPPRHDPEPAMSRTFVLPTARTFGLTGTAEINAGDSDFLIDQMIGLNGGGSPVHGAQVLSANSSTRLDEDRAARANAALDRDPSTAWIAETGPQAGEWVQYRLSEPVTFDHLDLQVINDGRHSLPSRITVSTPSGSRTVEVPVPAVGTGRPPNAVSAVPVRFPALSGSQVRVTIDAVHQVRALDYYSTFAGLTDILPVGIAELGLPGVVQPAPPGTIPATCRSDLLQVDGRPVWVQVGGTTAAALAGAQLPLRLCGPSASGVTLTAGRHTVTTADRLPTGWSIDQLWLASAAGGGAAASPAATVATPPAAPAVRVLHADRTSIKVQVTGTGRPSWLVLGESYSPGWSATSGGRGLGPPRLVDAFASGWLLPAVPPGQTLTLNLRWRPQTTVWAALAVSALAVLVCGLLAAAPRRRLSGGPALQGRRRGWSPAPVSAAGLLRLAHPASRSRRLLLAVAAVGWGLVAATVSRPAIGAVAAAAVAAAGGIRPGRAVVRLGAAAVLVALPVYEVAQQVAHRYWPDINWPGSLSSANDLAWTALALVGSDLVAGAIYARRPMRGET